MIASAANAAAPSVWFMSKDHEIAAPDILDRYGAILAGLPALLETARAILIAAVPTNHNEADDLRRRIEECTVDAHRLLLARRIKSADHGQNAGPGEAS